MTNNTTTEEQNETRIMTRDMRIVIVFALVASIFMAGYALARHQERSADIGVMPCSAWVNDSDPYIPAHTFTGACVQEDGTLSTPNK